MIWNNDHPAFREAVLTRARERFPDAAPDTVGMVGRFAKSAAAIVRDGKRIEIEGIATTSHVDADEEVVLPDGIDWDAFKSYQTLYLDHIYGARTAVAKLRYVTRHKSGSVDGWRLRAMLLPDDYSEEVKRVRMLAEAGMLGMSIGFIAADRGALTADEKRLYPKARSIVRKARVFEVSYTTMPCNLACAADRVYVDDEKAAGVRELVTKGLLPASYARAFAVPAPTVVYVPPPTVVYVGNN